MRSPVVLDLIVGASGKFTRNPRPPASGLSFVNHIDHIITGHGLMRGTEKMQEEEVEVIYDFKKDASKPVAPERVELKNKALLLGGHAASLETGVKVIDPAQAAALSCSVETYNMASKDAGLSCSFLSPCIV